MQIGSDNENMQRVKYSGRVFWTILLIIADIGKAAEV